MKNLNNLTKEELINFIHMNLSTVKFNEEVECGVCGITTDAEHFYVCDQCTEDAVEDGRLDYNCNDEEIETDYPNHRNTDGWRD